MLSDVNAINPYIRVAKQSVLSAGTEIKKRVIFDYELIYIEKGEFVLRYGSQRYECKKGQFILLRPGVSHSFSGIKKELSQPHIHFDMFYTEQSPLIPVSFKDITAFSEMEKKLIQEDIFAKYPQNPFVSFSQTDNALSLFYDIVKNPKLPPLTLKAKLIGLIEMLIADNFPNCFSETDGRYSIEAQLKDYIDAGQGTDDTLCDLEKQFNYSKYYIERRFKERYGTSLMAYRNERRMNEAKKLLKVKSVTDVSESLGFSSIYVFSRAFKRYSGLSPSEYKKKSSTD